ncbi:MAG: Asp-tRNA(Asn)/Glu-tRNA(Gln) amidotransferase subunit GatB [Alphaproteobacteria bacterium]|nr:Asp-tRNA(Asn)/Glu-tRNA(Gln) amidotransferase subunit GatB [Alphaproteobacteria bacterium]
MENINLIKGWEVIIGLEVHAQIATKSKLFSSSPTDFGAEPNKHVSFYDAAMPGMLPVLNTYAVDQAIKTGLAINGKINRISRFDRKNYFYPDLPSGYQITQMFFPIITGGYIDIVLQDGSNKRLNIHHIHMEQDAGKSVHDMSPGYSYIDLNRAGIPLMEIVSEPDMRSSYEAVQYVKSLRNILKYIGACDCNMEKGNLRVDANISIHKPNTPFGNRAEIKNINSTKFLGEALDYEIQRQILEIEAGNRIPQETRLFDAHTGETRTMRSKEDADEYRYFPDPDLKPLILEQSRIDKMKSELPELPESKKRRFINDYKLTEFDASVLVEDKIVADYYEKAVNASKTPKESAKLIANWILVELFAFLNKKNKNISELLFPIEYMAYLVDLIQDKTISGKIAKTVFASMIETNNNPRDIVKKLGLEQIQDDSVIKHAIEEVLKNNPKQLEQYKAGKVALFGFFVGQTMKALQGKGNPEMINNILMEVLDKK